MTDGPRLSRRPAAAHVDGGVELPDGIGQLERLRDDHAQRLAREVILEGTPVDQDATRAGPQPYARHGGLPPSRSVKLRCCSHALSSRIPAGNLELGLVPAAYGQRLRLLRGMRVIGAFVDPELASHGPAEAALG